MCGIIGFNFNDRKLAGDMLKSIEYRGPDDSDIFEDDSMTLGYVRLSIIDLPLGNQPIFNEDKTKLVFFNGEIYNYVELRKKLEKKHRFYTDSDTEVLIHLYEEYGHSFVSYLDGMFAFAIYDLKKKEIFLARDRLGVKPLYYYFKDNIFIFASEIKAILNYEINKEINKEVMSKYLKFRYCSGEDTIIKDIKKVLPGEYVLFRDNKIKVSRYWDLSFSIKNAGLSACSEELKNILSDSIRMRMRSDVPVGALLSGGIDSSAIVAHMRDNTEGKINTYSLGFDDSYNEFKFARLISEKFETDHHEIIIDDSELKNLPKVIWFLDEPVGDPTSIPNNILAENASKKVKVLLNGEGADELFAGYEQYKVFEKIPKINIDLPSINDPLSLRVSSFLKEKNLEKKYLESYGVSVFSSQELDKLSKLKEPKCGGYFRKNRGTLNNMLYRDIKTFLPDNMLLKFDRTTMASSVEGRVPFCSYKLAEFSAGLPEKFKLNGFNEKYILKYAMKEKLPKEITKRRKQRFFVPTDLWIEKKSKELVDYISSEKELIKTYFNKDYLGKLINREYKVSNFIFSGNKLTKLYYSRQIWTIMNFMIWHDLFIEGKKPGFKI